MVSGPKQKLSGRFYRRILRLASNSDKNLNEVKEELLNVSKTTIHRVIRRSKHIRRQKFKTAPRLLQHHKVQRNFFARNNMQRNWNQVRPLKPFGHFSRTTHLSTIAKQPNKGLDIKILTSWNSQPARLIKLLLKIFGAY